MLRTLEKIYVVASLVFLCGVGVEGNIGAGGLAGRATPQAWEGAGRLIFCALLAPLLLIHWRKILRGVWQSGWLVALCALAGASAFWSDDAPFVLRHAIFLTALTSFGIYIATRFDWDEMINLFGWMAVLVVVGCAVMPIVYPAYGLSQDTHLGAVKGLFPQKNTMGGMIVFAILTFAFAKPKGMPSWLRKAMLILACVLLVLSNSVTSILGLLFCLAMYPVLQLIFFPERRTLPLWVPLLPVFAMVAALGIANFDMVASSAGRNSSLTDRIPMWTELLNVIGRRPWLGYGYDIFWTEWSNDIQKVIYVLHGYRPPNAHNGYLDILLSMGIVGLLLFFGGLVWNFWQAGRLFKANEFDGAKWPLMLLLFFVVVNFGESYILRPMSFYWIPYVSMYVSLGLMAKERAWIPAPAASEVADGDEAIEVGGVLPGYPA